MARPLQITVKETIQELRSLQRKNGELVSKRLLMLIEIKRHEKTDHMNFLGIKQKVSPF